MLNAARSLALLFLTVAAVFGFTDTTSSAFEKQAEALRSKLKGRDSTIIVERPFIVIGDQPERIVRQWSEDVVRGTVARLKLNYFEKDPPHILEIWLFKDETSYRQHAKEFFNDEPGTPYGYYSPSKKVLVMNIATGGGTLVHEIVHPYIEANFPLAPAWFNEGLGSLYEQSGVVEGRIYGYPNWRLPGLQAAIRRGEVPTFRELLSMTDREFYRENTGTNYAQARYLCYYLQEKKLLVKFYRDFSANVATDPTGFKTLQKVLGSPDMKSFQRRWELFVMGLRY